MKKTLSRLVCVLLVVAMFCGMVPTVSANGAGSPPTGKSKTDPFVLYVGDSIPVDFTYTACTTQNHSATPTVVYGTEGIRGVQATASGYITYNATTEMLKADRSTISTVDGQMGLATVKLRCTGRVSNNQPCTTVSTETYYVQVYSKASSIALKNNGTLLANNANLTVLKGVNMVLDYMVLHSGSTWNSSTISTAKQNIDVKSTDTSIFDVSVSNGKITIEPKSVEVGSSAHMIITADPGTDHEITRVVAVTIAEASSIEIKHNNKVIAKTGDNPTKIVDAAVGDKMTLTATDTLGFAGTNLTRWQSSDDAVAAFTANGVLEVKKAGMTTIKATMGTTEATFDLRVIDKSISKVDIKNYANNVNVDSIELDAGTATFAVKAALTPTSTEAVNGEFVSWVSSDYEIVDFVSFGSGASFYQDIDTKVAMAKVVKLKAIKAGTATITATINGKTDTFTVKVNEVKPTKHIIEVVDRSEYDIRASVNDSVADVLTRMENKYKTVPAYYNKVDTNGVSTKTMTTVPVEWTGAIIDKNNRTAAVSGILGETDTATNFTYEGNKRNITVTVELTDGVAVTKVDVSVDKDKTTGGTTVRLTADAEVEPGDATVTYQWYQNGIAISGATSAVSTYVIPKDNDVNARNEYRFTCLVTATKEGKSGTMESPVPAVVSVERDYSISVMLDETSGNYEIGEDIKASATLYHKGQAQTTGFTWTLLAANGTSSVPSNKATISASSNAATVRVLGVDVAAGEKFVIQATGTYNGVTVTGSATVTVKPAYVSTMKMSMGSSGTIKANALTTSINTALDNSAIVPSYVVFGSVTGGKLTANASSSASIGNTKCYISGSTGQKLSDVYFTANSTTTTSATAAYSVYNASNDLVATGTINMDVTATDKSLTSVGATLEAKGLVDEMLTDGSSSSYVTFVSATGVLLYYDYKSFIDKAELDFGDRFYYSGSGKLLGKVYVLPIADAATGTVSYKVNGGSTETITFSIPKQYNSNVFTDVNSTNVGSWASAAIDFMADNGLVGGTGGRNFSPKNNMTRGQLVTILYRLEGKPSIIGKSVPFTDVARNEFYYEAVVWAYSEGVVSGNSATTFNPNGNITRQDIAVILHRYAGSPVGTGVLTRFSDSGSVATYATNAMRWAVGNGIIGGSGGKLNPKGQATRADVTVMLHRFLTK